MLTVGYLKMNTNMSEVDGMLAQYSADKAIELVYFTLDSFNFEQKSAKGLTYKLGEWIETTVPIPKFIDLEPSSLNSLKFREKLKELKPYTTLSTVFRYPLPRSRYPKYFSPSSFFYDKIIFRDKITTGDEIRNKLEEYSHIRLIPVKNARGLSNILLCEENNSVTVYDEKKMSKSSSDFTQLLEEYAAVGCFVERFYPSIISDVQEKKGFAHFEKGEEENWHLIKTSVEGEDDLSAYYTKYYKDAPHLLKESEDLLHHFIKVVERIRKKKFLSLQLHFVVDKVGQIHIGKVTYVNSIAGLEDRVLPLRASYYAFIAPRLQLTEAEESRLAQIKGQNKEIEEELLEYHLEEERKQKLIEQGLLEPERKQWTLSGILIIIALFFVLVRYVMKVFL